MINARTSALSTIIRDELIHLDGVRKFAPNRRFATIFTVDSPSESVFFLESGYVKLVRRTNAGKEILLSIVGPGELFGEQALRMDGSRQMSAEIMQEGVIYIIPRDLFLRFCGGRPQMWQLMTEMLTYRQRDLQQKVELLCLHDVESRILFYLSELAPVFGIAPGVLEYSLPISQSELAHLIGATRETTSTALNVLARNGLLKLGRRVMVVPSADAVRAAAKNRSALAATR